MLHYLTLMGSRAYGANNEKSDVDVYGFLIPDKQYVYPDFINGYEEPPKFEQTQFKKDINGTLTECTIFSLPRYFKLLEDNNPNILESLFTEENDVLYSTKVSELIRLNRHKFLSCKAIPRFLGYAISQRKKYEHSEKIKPWYHIMRLLLEGEQIIKKQDLDLKENSDILLDVRNGKITKSEIIELVKEKEEWLKNVKFDNINLPVRPDHEEIRALLISCLNIHYGP